MGNKLSCICATQELKENDQDLVKTIKDFNVATQTENEDLFGHTESELHSISKNEHVINVGIPHQTYLNERNIHNDTSTSNEFSVLKLMRVSGGNENNNAGVSGAVTAGVNSPDKAPFSTPKTSKRGRKCNIQLSTEDDKGKKSSTLSPENRAASDNKDSLLSEADPNKRNSKAKENEASATKSKSSNKKKKAEATAPAVPGTVPPANTLDTSTPNNDEDNFVNPKVVIEMIKSSNKRSRSRTTIRGYTNSFSPIKSRSTANKSVITTHVVSIIRNPPHIYFRGELFKYHPGFASPYIKKHCKATKNYFLYCEPQCRFDTNTSFARVDYKDIVSIKRVSVAFRNPPETDKYQFEIFMKSGWSLQYSSMPKQFYLEAQDLSLDYNPDKSADQLATRSRSQSKPNASVTVSPERPSRRHKMVMVDRVEFEGKKEALEYVDFVKKYGPALSRIQKKERVETKSPKKWIKTLGGMHTWNNRELEWYCAEERLLFAAKSVDECERWVWLLNWFISKQGPK